MKVTYWKRTVLRLIPMGAFALSLAVIPWSRTSSEAVSTAALKPSEVSSALAIPEREPVASSSSARKPTSSSTPVAKAGEETSSLQAQATPTPTTAPAVTTTTETPRPENPWPEIGSPISVKVHSVGSWEVYDIPVYAHIPETDENGKLAPNPATNKVELIPLDWQVADWTFGSWSRPGEEGYSLLAGHQSQVFEPFADGGVPLGTRIEVIDDRNNLIHLETILEPAAIPKEGLPWDEMKNVAAGDSITWFITCGDGSDPIYTEGPYKGRSFVNYVTPARVVSVEYSTEGSQERFTFVPS